MSSAGDSDCPRTDELQALAAGELPPASSAELEDHLSRCGRCREALEALSDFDSMFAVPLADEPGAASTPVLTELIGRLSGEPDAVDGDDALIADDGLAFLKPPIGDEGIGSLGSYPVLEEVARGGNGIVLKARDPDLHRTVAIKLLSPARASVAGSRERFLREARAAARLDHDNVMPIYSIDQTGDLPYIVVPFVDGSSLQERLDTREPVEIDEVVRIGYEVCLALEAAHAQGLVHRDVKPANIMLLEDRRRVWLADFGLATAPDDGSVAAGSRAIAGTPAFMAPEQARGEEVDHRADLFSLGCVLYAMVAGESPFQADSAQGCIEKLRREEAPPLRTVAKVPDWLSDLVAKLLCKESGGRPQSATQVREILSKHLPDQRRIPVLAKLALGLSAAAAVAAAVMLAVKPAPPSPPVEVGTGFQVAGQEGVLHLDLSEAIAAAGSGDTILVRGSGDMTVGLTSIRDKALTIQAEAGSLPVFVANSVRTAVLQTDSPLRVEGIAFKHPDSKSPVGALPLLRVRGAPLFVANCRFERNTAAEFLAPLRMPAMVEVRDGARIEIINSEFRTGVGKNLVIEETASGFDLSARLANNLIVGQMAIFFEAFATGRYDWELERNTIAGSAAVFIRSARDAPPEGNVLARGNAFEFRNSVLILGSQGGVMQTDAFGLRGDNNLFRPMAGAGSSRVRYAAPRWGRGGIAIESHADFAATFGEIGRESSESLFSRAEDVAERPQDALSGPSEQFRLGAAYAAEREGTGCDFDLLGPGEPYDHWRATEAYATWRERVATYLR